MEHNMEHTDGDGSWTDDTMSHLDVEEDGRHMKVMIACPVCRRTIKVVRIASDQEKLLKNIRCKNCPIAGFDWTYEPMKVGGRYVYITASASVSAENMPKMRRHNEKLKYSNR